MNAKNLMIQGTMSGVGKSLITAGICRIYTRRGLRVAPFKSQNMALNSYVTADGGEIGTATALQAMACLKEPTVEMNPVLLKPSTDTESQVIVNGRAVENLSAGDYFKKKKSLMPTILSDYDRLSAENDLIVIEGAGSCCELNLRKDDIVNMGMASAVNAPVLLVGDIDRGGIFAQLYGSVALLPENEQELIKGLIVNKFRGDSALFSDGVKILEEKTHKPVVGVLPYTRLDLPEEDSLSEKLSKNTFSERHASQHFSNTLSKHLQNETQRISSHSLNSNCQDQLNPDSDCNFSKIDIVVIRFPKISNYTDFLPLERLSEVSVRYVCDVSSIGSPDLIILPGTKNTIADLRWLKKTGIAEFIKTKKSQIPILGICGGYQMLGESISDPFCIEEGGTEEGLGLIPMTTVMEKIKTTRQVEGSLENGGFVRGYEIHCGSSHFTASVKPLIPDVSGKISPYINPQMTHDTDLNASPANRESAEVIPNEDFPLSEGIIDEKNIVAGTYWHGFFDETAPVQALMDFIFERKGMAPKQLSEMSQRESTNAELDRLADILEANLDMNFLDSLIF